MEGILYGILVCELIIFLPIFYVMFVYPAISLISEFVFRKKLLNVGDVRIIEKVIFWPIKIEDEWRWFRQVKIKQRHEVVVWEDIMGCPVAWGWVNKAWVD